MICDTLTLIPWICYPVSWGVCEGGNVTVLDSEVVFYGVLDLLRRYSVCQWSYEATTSKALLIGLI